MKDITIRLRINEETREKLDKDRGEETISAYIRELLGVVNVATKKKKRRKRTAPKKNVATKVVPKPKVTPIIVEHTAKGEEFRSYFKK